MGVGGQGGGGGGGGRARHARAQEMKSQNYVLQGGNFNITSGNKESQNFKLSDVVGQTAAGTFASKGFIINAGFLNGAAGETFSFSVSPTVIDFGNLTPETPVERTLKIKIGNGNAAGYLVTVSENQPLSTSVEAVIPDTSCDSAAGEPCTAKQASLWTKNTNYGFGYRMAGLTVPVDYTRENYYRPFPSSKRSDQPIPIMQSEAKKVIDDAIMTLKVNIGPNQPVGQYRNVLSFTALAGI